MERGAAPGAEASMLERAGNPTPRPILDVHNVKERDATGTVSCANEALAKSTRTRARAQGTRLDSGCSAGRDAGRLPLLPTRRRVPCAGYSGFVIEPCSGRLLIREEPRYAMHAPTNCQPFGRSDRPVAALSAVAICDAIRIGFLGWLAE